MLQKLVQSFKIENILLENKKSLIYYIEKEKYADVITQNSPLLSNFKGLVSTEMLKRMAQHNITCY